MKLRAPAKHDLGVANDPQQGLVTRHEVGSDEFHLFDQHLYLVPS